MISMRRPIIMHIMFQVVHERAYTGRCIPCSNGLRASLQISLLMPSDSLRVHNFIPFIFFFHSLFFLLVLKSCYGCWKKCVNCLIVLVHFSRYSHQVNTVVHWTPSFFLFFFFAVAASQNRIWFFSDTFWMLCKFFSRIEFSFLVPIVYVYYQCSTWASHRSHINLIY